MPRYQYQSRGEPLQDLTPVVPLPTWYDGISPERKYDRKFRRDHTVPEIYRQTYYNRNGYSFFEYNSGSSTPTLSCSTPSNTRAGNVIFVTVRAYHAGGTGAITITDSNSNIYTQAIRKEITGGGETIAIFWANNVILSIANTITVAVAGGTTFSSVETLSYDVLGGILNLDATATGESTSSVLVTSSAFSTTDPNELVIPAVSYNAAGSSIRFGTSYTKINEDVFSALADRDTNGTILSGDTITATYFPTSANSMQLAVATFKIPSSIITYYSGTFPDTSRRNVRKNEGFNFYTPPFQPAPISFFDGVGPTRLVRKNSFDKGGVYDPPYQPPAIIPTFFDGVFPSRTFKLLRRDKGGDATPPYQPLSTFYEIFNPERTFARKAKYNTDFAFVPNPLKIIVLSTFYDAVYDVTSTKKRLDLKINRNRTKTEFFNPPLGATIVSGTFQHSSGYPIFIEPSLTTGSYEEVIDYGTVITNTIITIAWTLYPLVGTVTVTPRIAYSTNGISYSAFTNATSAYAPSVRYAKIRLEFTGADDKSLAYVGNLQVTLAVKREIDSGSLNVLASDTGGTQVNFNKHFRDIDSITVTPQSTTYQIAIYDFVDIPDPVGFKILLFNSSGVRINGLVSWKARGIV